VAKAVAAPTSAFAALAILLDSVVAPTYPAASGFGLGWSCTDDLAVGTMVSGNRIVAEACYRRLITPRGTLIDDPNYGTDLTSLIDSELAVATQSQQTSTLARMFAMVDQEMRKDERVLSSATTGAFVSSVLTVAIAIRTATGPFQLVIAVSGVTVTLLRAPGLNG
jgi:phage baseplate assembly protein W